MQPHTWQVLIVEDDQRLAELTCDYLQNNGLSVTIERSDALAEARINALLRRRKAPQVPR
ncbi:hypothetical protein N018_06830 [Pseudomonas syringae CC1557]|uniref:Response regulatory domain-containing protein n=1 Tax=Pseudomonas syringae CC1557 TaxID=1357279 RepID=W0MYL3_PSESX|nr:hypothetical protein N018_06830 [Pseudomonas syringae CC1557]